jgi:hypothetical protein
MRDSFKPTTTVFAHGARANYFTARRANQGLDLEWIFEAHRYR